MNDTYDPLASVQSAGPPGTISFSYGLPDPETFPVTELQSAFVKVFEERASVALQYGPGQGYGPLIDYLRRKVKHNEGINLERSQIMISGGASQALDHLCTVFTRTSDIVLVEAPTYHDSIHLFRDQGLDVLQIQTDDQGMILEDLVVRLEELKERGKKPRFLYTIPTFQNPSGITLSESRRRAIIDLAEESDFLIVEDDVYFDLAYADSKKIPMFLLGNGKRVLRLGSFSKIISPGLRLGWTIGPEELIDKLINSGYRHMGGGANPLVANAISHYCQQGLLEPHIASVLSIYKKRRDIMLKSLESYMPEGVSWTRPQGGFFIWITLPHPLRSSEVVEWGESEGILFLGGDPFFAETETGQHLRLSFSYVQPDKIQEGIEKLGQILKSKL
jgi:2-aminoadipate transaminase